MNIIAIDPGPESSALVIYDPSTRTITDKSIQENEVVLARVGFLRDYQPGVLVIEQVASFGMPVGADVFETVFWSGRFAQEWSRTGFEFHRLKRHEIKMHLCKHPRAKDSNIRQALLDKFGPQGTKKAPGTLYGVSKDLWAALAVAVTFAETTSEPSSRRD